MHDVLDQDEALDFYVGKLGMVVHTDADVGVMRFLTVTLPDQPDPFGNPIRFTQPPDGPMIVPSPEELRAQA